MIYYDIEFSFFTRRFMKLKLGATTIVAFRRVFSVFKSYVW